MPEEDLLTGAVWHTLWFNDFGLQLPSYAFIVRDNTLIKKDNYFPNYVSLYQKALLVVEIYYFHNISTTNKYFIRIFSYIIYPSIQMFKAWYCNFMLC